MCLLPQKESAARPTPQVTPALVRALAFIRDVVAFLPPREILLERPTRPPVLIWSDGAAEREGTINTIGFLIGIPRSGAAPRRDGPLEPKELEDSYDFYHGAGDVEQRLMRRLLGRSQQIGQVELVGAVAPYLSLPSSLAGREVIHWIDNTSALAALTKGYSGVPDSAHIVHIFHAWAACAATNVWFEYVPSAANPADEPSRDLTLAHTPWHIEAGPVSRPIACIQPPIQRLQDPAGWAREAAAVQRA